MANQANTNIYNAELPLICEALYYFSSACNTGLLELSNNLAMSEERFLQNFGADTPNYDDESEQSLEG